MDVDEIHAQLKARSQNIKKDLLSIEINKTGISQIDVLLKGLKY